MINEDEINELSAEPTSDEDIAENWLTPFENERRPNYQTITGYSEARNFLMDSKLFDLYVHLIDQYKRFLDDYIKITILDKNLENTYDAITAFMTLFMNFMVDYLLTAENVPLNMRKEKYFSNCLLLIDIAKQQLPPGEHLWQGHLDTFKSLIQTVYPANHASALVNNSLFPPSTTINATMQSDAQTFTDQNSM
ncbi:MAG: hypothetical protein WC627_10415 [Legionella sp.]|jgi:hypothetical protein